MKKETIIAIFFGVVFGSIVAIFLLVKNKELQLNKTKTLAPSNNNQSKPKKANLVIKPLEITEPQDSEVIDSYTITIKGKAEKDSLIIVQSPIKEVIINNQKGDFSLEYPLSLGENIIKISMHPKNSLLRSQEKELRVYNLNEEL